MAETVISAERDKDSVSEAGAFLSERWGRLDPAVCLVCGSGWGKVVEDFGSGESLSYSEIPGMSQTTVSGHAGNLHLRELGNKQFLVFQGRRHYYEGVGWGPIRFPILLAKELGTETLFLTNAAGGLSPSFEVADLMVLRDHLNFMPVNPLIGPVLHPDSPRFPDQSQVYDPELRRLLCEVGEKHGVRIHQGSYLALSGPAFETPAEISAFAKLGADAVGMSTVPEAMLGNALGMKVVGLSCISNLAAGISEEPLSHDDVEKASAEALPKMKRVVRGFLEELLAQGLD